MRHTGRAINLSRNRNVKILSSRVHLTCYRRMKILRLFTRTLCRRFQRFLLSATTINFHYSKKAPNSGRVSRNAFTQLVLVQAENLHFCRATKNWCLSPSLLAAPVKWNYFRVTPLKICQFAFFHNMNIKQYINLRSFSIGASHYRKFIRGQHVISWKIFCLIQKKRERET